MARSMASEIAWRTGSWLSTGLVRLGNRDTFRTGGNQIVAVRRILGDVERLDVRDVLAAPLRLALREEQVGRRVAEERRIVDLLDRGHRMAGRALPVVRVVQVLDVLRRAARHQVRAGADGVGVRVGVELALIQSGPDVLRHDRRLVGDEVEVRLRRRVEGEDHLVSLEGHVRERTAIRAPQRVEVDRLVALHRVERVGDVGRAERLAVAPGRAAADRERERLEAVRPLPTWSPATA